MKVTLFVLAILLYAATYSSEGQDLSLLILTDKSYLANQPVIVHARLKNLSSDSIFFVLITGTSEISISMKSDEDQKLYGIPQLPSLGGTSVIYSIKPGESTDIPLYIDRYLSFSKAGEYSVQFEAKLTTSKAAKPFIPGKIISAADAKTITLIPSSSELLIKWINEKMTNWNKLSRAEKYELLQGISISELSVDGQYLKPILVKLNKDELDNFIVMLWNKDQKTREALLGAVPATSQLGSLIHKIIKDEFGFDTVH